MRKYDCIRIFIWADKLEHLAPFDALVLLLVRIFDQNFLSYT
jgi:hypothetical protein